MHRNTCGAGQAADIADAVSEGGGVLKADLFISYALRTSWYLCALPSFLRCVRVLTDVLPLLRWAESQCKGW